MVLIVGAGPTGLALALFLLKAGVKPRIIDQNSGPGTASRALGVQARTLELYAQLGIAGEAVEQGIELQTLFLRRRGRVAARINIGRFGLGISPYPFVLSFPQDQHEKWLMSHLRQAGVTVEWGTTLAEVLDTGPSVEAVVQRQTGDTEVIGAAYVCGCDGARSTVRQQLKLPFEGGTYDKTYFVADVAATGAAAGTGSFSLCLGSQGVLLVMPVRELGIYRLIGVVPKGVPNDDTLAFAALKPFVERQAAIKVTQVNWFSTYRAHHRIASQFRRGRIFLAGDAGHIHSPVGGQGMNTGIGDAVNLAWKLAAVVRGRAAPALLDSYEPERMQFARLLIRTTDRLFRLMVGSSLGARLFRSVVLPSLAPIAIRLAPVRAKAFRTVSQARIDYRESALSSGVINRLHGGERLPWIRLDSERDNYAALRGFNWQLHVYGTASHPLRALARSLNLPLHEFVWTETMRAGNLQCDALYLIRPDGYLAHVDAEQNMERLRAVIDRYALRFTPADGDVNDLLDLRT